MNIRCVTTITDALLLAPAWQQLAPAHPFLTWDWLSCWWSHFLGECQLLILVGYDDQDQVLGIAPFFVEPTPLRGRVVRFLGSGKACSDHMTLICPATQRDRFAVACARWLSQSNDSASGSEHWDYVEWIGSDADDPAMSRLCDELEADGHRVTRSEGQPCYYLDLSDGWLAYLKKRTNSSRRYLRKLEKQLDQSNIGIQVYTTADQLVEHWDTFKELHQKRHCTEADAGCFGHPGFETFLFDATMRFAEQSVVQLLIVTADGTPISAAYNFETADRSFNYQSGMDPAYAELRPGFLALVAILRDIDRRNYRGLDLLRGDEPYKARWRATRVATKEIRIPCRRARSLVMHELWRTSHSMKNALRTGAFGSEV